MPRHRGARHEDGRAQLDAGVGGHARLRAVPAHRLRPVPQRAPAAVRPCLQGPDRVVVLGHETAPGDQGRHLERRGRPGWGEGRERQDGAPLRGARLLAAARPHLPGADRRARGLLRPDDRAGEHPARRARVPQPGRRVAAEGDRGRARREAEGEDAAAARDQRARPQRQRRRGLRVVGELPALPARLPDDRAARRASRERAELRLLPHADLLRSRREGSEAGREEARRASSAPPT